MAGIHMRDEGEQEIVAHVYIPLYEADTGRTYGRSHRSEFLNRTPVGVSLTKERAVVTVVNSGPVASDLITLEWRVRFCTFDPHLPTEGFTIAHAKEVVSDPFGDYFNIEFLEGGESKSFGIEFPEYPSDLANVYFQARVSTLWTGAVKPDLWAGIFATDPGVTEAHCKP